MPQPYASLNKTSYRKLCDFISDKSPPEHSRLLLDLMAEAMFECLNFDPKSKKSTEECRIQAMRQRNKCEQEGTTIYEKANKPRYERLKKQYPNVPTQFIVNTRIKDLPMLEEKYKKQNIDLQSIQV